MYLLDTNICIYAMKNTYSSLTGKLFEIRPSDIYISSVTVGELEYGCSPDPSFIRRQWEDRYHYFEYMSRTVPVVHSEEFLCDATLKGEFVRVVNAANGLSDRERTRILRCGLRALSGESLF